MARLRFAVAAAVFAALAALVPVALAAGAKVRFVRSSSYTDAGRPFRSIDRIVVHSTEGRFRGSLRALRKGGSSAHYLVARDGRIVQLVSTSDIAWHAGNWRMNVRSIGIEHEGWAFRRGSFTDAEYRASAQLVGYLARRAGIPIDRKHIIGHNEVPDPSGGGYGGADRHRDPGPYWNWRRYMALVRRYAKDPQKPDYVSRPVRLVASVAPPRPARPRRSHRGLHAWTTSLRKWETVRGKIAWKIHAGGRGLRRVEFRIDGKLVWRDRVGPYTFAQGRRLNTVRLPNGVHTLNVRAFGRGARRVGSTIPIVVRNPELRVDTAGLVPGSVTGGVVRLSAGSDAVLRSVALLVDGEQRQVIRGGPFAFAWDSSEVADGPHVVTLQAKARDSRRTSVAIPVTIDNTCREACLPLARALASF